MSKKEENEKKEHEQIRREIFSMGIVAPQKITKDILYCREKYLNSACRHATKVFAFQGLKEASTERKAQAQKEMEVAAVKAYQLGELYREAIKKQRRFEDEGPIYRRS